MKTWVFTLCFSFFLGHELDAVSQAEWRLLYGFRDLAPHVAQVWFVLLHVPLLALLFGLCWHRRRATREYSRQLFAGFSVVHGALHYYLRAHPLNGFDTLPSQALIGASTVLGGIYWLGCIRASSVDARQSMRRCASNGSQAAVRNLEVPIQAQYQERPADPSRY